MKSLSKKPLSERQLSEKQVEALTVAMIVAPGVYARNRMFDLLSSAGAQRAKRRAAIVRGVVRQLARASAITLASEARGDQTLFVLRFAIPALRLTRVVELSAGELAALRLIAERAGVRALPPDAGDKERAWQALRVLMNDDFGHDSRDPLEVVARIGLAEGPTVPPAD